MRLLVIEDEPELGPLIRDALERSGFATDLAVDLGSADDRIALTRYDTVILDLALQDGGALLLLQRRRLRESISLLVLTDLDECDDHITELGSAAADYLTKPFHMSELIASVCALLRRPGAALGESLSLGNIVLNTITRQVRVDDTEIGLSDQETVALELLLRHQGHVVLRDLLQQNLQSCDAGSTSNAMDALLDRLRCKLSNAAATPRVHVLHGVGYLLIGMQ